MPHAVAKPHVVKSTINYYLDPAKGGHESFYFGLVGEKRRPFEYVEVDIADIRGREDEFSLDVHGFQHVKADSIEKEYEDLSKIKELYYPECAELVKKMTGASRVVVTGHVCRRQSWDDFKEAAKSLDDMERTPTPTTARYVHVDYSYDGAVTRLEYYLPNEAAALQQRRWAIINIWRPIQRTVTRDNLAVCDARSIAESELRPVLAKFRVPDQDENLAPITRAAYTRNDVETWSVAPPSSPTEHKWHYVSQMRPDEALLLKIFDSKKEGVARRSPHTAFVCNEDHGLSRQSIEVRTLVFWDDQANE